MNQEKHMHGSLLINLESEHIVFDYISNGIAITDEHSMILYTNPAFTRITGYTKEEMKGKNPGVLHSGRHEKHFYEEMWDEILKKGFWNGEIWNRRKSGEIYPEFLTISKINQNGANGILYIAIFADISFLKKDISQKLHLAFYDPLTELPNRTLYLDRINKNIETIKNGSEKKFSVFYMDLDKFKQVNDTYGHCVGDKLLKMVGERLASSIRTGDTVARMGGDEFAAIVMLNVDPHSMLSFSRRIIDTIEKPFIIDGHHINISISIGISSYPDDSRNVEALLVSADKAMYIAKKTGTKIEFSNAENISV
ncbi:MAG: diguanylate cyclase [Legionellales bacterium]|nr:diguanylate cyclase [Legionellales bacterium]